MGLNKQKGNMYGFITDTWNTIKGKCQHNCQYCYMPQQRLNAIRFDTSELKTDLGQDNYIFVGSSCDMWASNVLHLWIMHTLLHCKLYNNKYLFQTKNPKRFMSYIPELKELNCVLCVTIESNKEYKMLHNAPLIKERIEMINNIQMSGDIPLMVTIEPILDFDIEDFSEILKHINPKYVNIGADSKGHKLPEPSKEKIIEFITELKSWGLNILEEKKNLKRLLQ